MLLKRVYIKALNAKKWIINLVNGTLKNLIITIINLLIFITSIQILRINKILIKVIVISKDQCLKQIIKGNNNNNLDQWKILINMVQQIILLLVLKKW